MSLTAPDFPGLYNIFMFRDSSASAESHSSIAGCNLLFEFDVIAQYDIAIHPDESAIAFDGIDDFVLVNSLGTGCPGLGGFTFEFWVRCMGDCTGAVVMDMPACGIRISLGGSFDYLSRENSLTYVALDPTPGAVLSLQMDAASTTTVATSYGIVTDGRWHHIAAVVSNVRATMFVDGMPGESTALILPHSGPAPVSTIPSLILGGRMVENVISDGTANHFSGFLAEARLWHTVLSAKSLYDGMRLRLGETVGTDGTTSPTAAWYLGFNEYTRSGSLTLMGGAVALLVATPFMSMERMQVTFDTTAREPSLRGLASEWSHLWFDSMMHPERFA